LVEICERSMDSAAASWRSRPPLRNGRSQWSRGHGVAAGAAAASTIRLTAHKRGALYNATGRAGWAILPNPYLKPLARFDFVSEHRMCKIAHDHLLWWPFYYNPYYVKV
jgi:hypothetical protein